MLLERFAILVVDFDFQTMLVHEVLSSMPLNLIMVGFDMLTSTLSVTSNTRVSILSSFEDFLGIGSTI